MTGTVPVLAAVPIQVIFVIAALVVNGLVALWKKSKERAAAAEAARAARPGGAAEIDARMEQRRVQRAAPRAAKVKPQAPAARKPAPGARPSAPVIPASVRPAAPPVPVRVPVVVPAPPVPAAAPSRAAAPAAPALARGLLGDRRSLRRGILLGELLGPPRATAPYRPVA